MIYGDCTAKQRYCLSWTNAADYIGVYLISSQTGIFPYPMGCISTEIQLTNSLNSKAYRTTLQVCVENLFNAKKRSI